MLETAIPKAADTNTHILNTSTFTLEAKHPHSAIHRFKEKGASVCSLTPPPLLSTPSQVCPRKGAERPALASCPLPVVGAGREAQAPAGTQAPPTTSPDNSGCLQGGAGPYKEGGAPQSLAQPLRMVRVGQTCPNWARPPSDPPTGCQSGRTGTARGVHTLHFPVPGGWLS